MAGMIGSRAPVAAEEARLRQLWDEHAGSLLGLVLRLNGGDRAAAEDVVQETLLRAWRHPEALDPAPGSLRSWLFTVARRLVIDEHRARRARPTETRDERVADPAANDNIDAALERLLITDALAALSPPQREVLLHTYYPGRTVGEAARTLGVPPDTVKSRVFHALKVLELALEERGLTT